MQNNTFSTLFVGQNLIKLAEVDSTNNYLKLLLSKSEPLPEGTVIMADNQFAGRGQQHNLWQSEPGKNLTFSLYLKPKFLPVQQQFLLNMAISVALNNALSEFLGDEVKIKWPNDIYYQKLKLGGILIENLLSGQTYKSGIIGIGLNVNQVEFSGDLNYRAISLSQILHKNVDLTALLAVICSHIESQYLKLRGNNYFLLQVEYQQKLFQFEKTSKYRYNGRIIEGMITAVTEQGLLVINSKGVEKAYNFKEVEFII
ncbi:BirA family biotin operon repressor/biotin-[acetyl-CoA-carboxylase] ligase [Pedobacter sp. CG_S7]|uniref:biotin--[acetyl-CoA-carboxylase] ligase n=1 Tax=Pedobacter sp. CG_S7 TaxID=3143930 RepID=UPI0033996D58